MSPSRLLPLCLLLAGCWPDKPHDCRTQGGIWVLGGECDAELERMQARIEARIEAMGYAPHALDDVQLIFVTQHLDAEGGFTAPQYSYPVRGLTLCAGPVLEVARNNGEPLYVTSLAHESFHRVQNCASDDRIEQECLAAGGDPHTCAVDAMHPHWHDAVYPAIDAINAEAKAEQADGGAP